jgi:hypothetical protein
MVRHAQKKTLLAKLLCAKAPAEINANELHRNLQPAATS